MLAKRLILPIAFLRFIVPESGIASSSNGDENRTIGDFKVLVALVNFANSQAPTYSGAKAVDLLSQVED